MKGRRKKTNTMAITNSDLPFLLERVEGRFPNSRVRADSQPQTGTLDAIIAEQTADIRFFNLPDEPTSYLTWMLDCGQEVEACTDDCDYTGPDISTFKQTASIDQCAENSFGIAYDAWRHNEFGMMDAVAMKLDRIMRDHLLHVEQYSVGVINANVGVNTSVAIPGTWTNAGGIITIPGNEAASTAIFGYIQRLGITNLFEDPYVLSGAALAQLQYLATTSGGNGEGKGDALRMNQMRTYFDLFNIDLVNTPNLDFYQIDRGILAFGSKGYYPIVNDPENPRGAQQMSYGKLRFSVRNRWVPQLIHDIMVEDRCGSGLEKQFWNVKTRYKTLAAPEGCLADNTGILRFRVDGALAA